MPKSRRDMEFEFYLSVARTVAVFLLYSTMIYISLVIGTTSITISSALPEIITKTLGILNTGMTIFLFSYIASAAFLFFYIKQAWDKIPKQSQSKRKRS